MGLICHVNERCSRPSEFRNTSLFKADGQNRGADYLQNPLARIRSQMYCGENGMIKRIQSDFLFAQPSSMSGIASTIDLWGQLTSYNTSEGAQEADENALAADWLVTGQDIEHALRESTSSL